MSKGSDLLIEAVKWWVTAVVSVLISNYLIAQLGIVNLFLIILLTATVILILIQVVRSHDNELSFTARWFIFYFLVYAIIILVMKEYFLPTMAIAPTGILSSIIIGFIISGVMILIEKIGIKSRTVPWISFILLCLLIVANLGHLQTLTEINLQSTYKNSSVILGDGDNCPIPSAVGALVVESNFKNSQSSQQYKVTALMSLINSSVWRSEHNFDSCYLGKYQGQRPEWMYCDNLIVSRWETGSDGTINYRWYTAVSAQWRPQSTGSKTYVFDGFVCENGQKVTVAKGVTNYYVYDSRDGSKIRIAY